MSFNVFENSQQRTGFILCLVFGPLSIIATFLRFVATKRLHRNYSWDDWYALLALIFFLPYVGYALWVFSLFNGRSPLVFFKEEPGKIHVVLKMGNVMNGLYGLQQSFAKFSLLALYYRLFWVNRKFSIAVWIVAIVQGAWGLVVLLVHLFACSPIAKVWNPTLHGSCINPNTFFSIYEPINSFLDFVVAGLAIWMLPSLQVKRSTLWQLAILFAIGGFSGIIGIIKVAEAQHAARNNFRSVIWNIVQMTTSIICCCAPIYKSIFPKLNLYTKVHSWALSTFGSKMSQDAPSDHAGSSRNFPTAAHQSAMSDKRNQRSHWGATDDSSERALAWAESGGGNLKDGSLYHQDRADPTGTVKVERSVDIV